MKLRLRRLVPGDLDPLFAYRSDREVSRYQSWEPASTRVVQDFIEEQATQEPDVPHTWLQLALTLRSTGEMIGDLGLHTLEEGCTQVGITLARAQQGQGYATEALLAALGYLFDDLGKRRVFASVDPRNHGSMALMGRVGMRQEAHHRESLWFKGTWADDAVFAMLAWEWSARAS